MSDFFNINLIEETDSSLFVNSKEVSYVVDTDLSSSIETWYKIQFRLPSNEIFPKNGSRICTEYVKINSEAGSPTFRAQLKNFIKDYVISSEARSASGMYDGKALRQAHKEKLGAKRRFVLAQFMSEIRWISVDLLPNHVRSQANVLRLIS